MLVLDTAAGIGDLIEDRDLAAAIVEGAGAFAAGTFAPLNRIGDEVGAKWTPEGVTMPEGFARAYRAYVEGGWGSLAGPEAHGGQGLPLTLATVVLEDLGSANMGFSLCLVPKILPDGSRNDLRCVSIEHKLGIHASPTCVMAYGDEGGATGWLVGEENKGMAAMFTMMNNARLNVGLQGVSIAERATQQAVAYARERMQGSREGRPARIIEFPDVRRMMLRMKALTQAARALAYCCAGQTDRAERGDDAARARADLLTPLVKAYGTDVGVEVASLGVQIHGGMGY